MVGVSCSKGGSQISFWQPGSPALDDAVSRYKAAKLFLKKNGYTVRRKLMVWCQGEVMQMCQLLLRTIRK